MEVLERNVPLSPRNEVRGLFGAPHSYEVLLESKWMLLQDVMRITPKKKTKVFKSNAGQLNLNYTITLLRFLL